MIQSVQVSRGLAASAVAVYHVYLIFLQKFNVPTFEVVAQFGYLGVPYFFVLSGFIIAYAHLGDIGRPQRLGSFLWRRFVRLYPVYWIFSGIYVSAAILGLGDADLDLRPIAILENITLFHISTDFISPPLKVAWTLFYEVRFYALFALAIFAPRTTIVVMLAWAVAGIWVQPENAFTAELLSFWNFAFLCGVAAATIYRFAPPRVWPIIAIMGLALCSPILLSGALALKDTRSWIVLAISGGFALIVLALALCEKSRSFPRSKIALLLGDASYSIYLVHSAVISVSVIIISKLGLHYIVPLWFLFFPVLFSSIAAGVVAHIIVERPALRALRKVAYKPKTVPIVS